MKNIKIGFPLSRGGGGPTIFMRRLREEIRGKNLAGTAYFFDPFADILICGNAIRNPWQKPFILRLDGIAFDLALGCKEIYRRNNPIFKGIERAAGLIFQANFSRKLISAFYSMPNKPFVTIPNGVDLNTFTPEGRNLRAELGLNYDDLVFLTSAKWRSHKRLEATITAFERFCGVSERVAYLIVLGELDKIPYSIPARVRLVGHVEPKELPLWYRSADVCMFLSWLDNCPNTVVEALASGLPVLATNQGGTKELLQLTDGGIAVQADAEFQFTSVELYKPPEPDLDMIIKGMFEIVESRKFVAANIKRELIGIDSIARQYVGFSHQVINSLKILL